MQNQSERLITTDDIEFDLVFRMTDGAAARVDNLFAPDTYLECGSDGQVLDGAERYMFDTLESQGWEPVLGFSGQDRYSGPIMHVSEQFAGNMRNSIAQTDGVYVLVAVECYGDEGAELEPAGWMLLRQVPKLTADDVTVERISHSGMLVLTASDADGYLITRKYIGYTREEAMELFLQEITTKGQGND